MGRTLSFALLVSFFCACVTVEPPPEPRHSIKPGQRLIVMVHQSPGPWIVADPDSKAESAMKLLPMGTFLQGIQEDRINNFSKEIQPYLPRPRYDQAVESALITALKAAHGGQVQTAAEAGISPAQRREWNAASDQLDWRRKYYFTDGQKTPRDYSKLLSLDDAVIIDVNVSFGVEPAADESERSLPLLSAASRAYRADTSRLLWGREQRMSDETSSTTLTEFRAEPVGLTDRLYAMSSPLGAKIAADLSREAGLIPPAPPILAPAPEPSPAPVEIPVSTGAPDISTAPLVSPAAPPEASTAPAASPPAAPAETAVETSSAPAAVPAQ